MKLWKLILKIYVWLWLLLLLLRVGTASETPSHSGIYNGIYTGLTYYRYDYSSTIDIVLQIFADNSKTEAIQGIFIAPKWLAPFDSQSLLKEVEQSNSPSTYVDIVNKQVTLNGYTPKNKKLLTFPYNYLLLSNNIGQNAILHYEKFSDSSCYFKVSGVLNPRLLNKYNSCKL